MLALCIPACYKLGRPSLDATHRQRHGLGKALLRDAILRTIQVSQMVGVRALLVHALSRQAATFYEAHGFHASPLNARTLFLSLSDI